MSLRIGVDDSWRAEDTICGQLSMKIYGMDVLSTETTKQKPVQKQNAMRKKSSFTF
jgi:hypothetical protein